MDDLLSRLASLLRGRYAIERELGRGGMATVYLARDVKHDRAVAVKVLDPALAQAIGSGRFLQEIRIAARLTHPNILPLHDSGEADGLFYYVMPYIEGESLRDRLERDRHLPVQEAVRIIGQVGAALGHAHRQGIIHRDIKPENILLAGDQALLTDFGVARALDAADPERLTATGVAVGTPAYMSPEQVGADRSLDGRSDVYSLGCVAYEMLGGSPPFTGPSAQAVMARHAVDPVPRLRTLRPAIPEGLEQVVEQALAKVPADRFPAPEEFATAMAQAGSPQGMAKEQERRRRARGRRIAAIAAGIAVLAAGAWWVVNRSGRPDIRRFAVLPFDNPVVDPNQSYFVDGVHEALISDLASDGLGVIARTSVLQYRHSDKPARVIARELGVDALVETSLVRTTDSVTIHARLVDGHTEQYRWSHDYTVATEQVPALAHEVAQGIARVIRPGAQEPASSAPATRTVDPEVYDLYLQGMSHLHRPTRADLETSRQYFERAIAKDSTYAPAWAGLGAVWGIGRQRGYFTNQEATPPSEAAAYKAIALDSSLALAHYVLAEIKTYVEWDWPGADREFRRAIALRPDYAEARAFYSHLLCILHRPKEAIEQLTRARELDPLDPLLAWIEGATFTIVHRYDDAIGLYREALKRSPDNPGALWLLWLTLHQAGRYDEAYPVLQHWAVVQRDSGLIRTLAEGHRRAGYAGAIQAAADYLAADSTSHAWDLAIWYASAGENGRALDYLERAYDGLDPAMPYLGVHPSFEALHGDPRFQELMRRMNLPR